MQGLLQRVTHSKVEVDGDCIGHIEQGLTVLIGIERSDTRSSADKLLHKLLNYRVFSDVQGKMNLSVQDINGGLLLIPQFTLAANTRSGMRPSFSEAAAPALGKELFNYLVEQAQSLYNNVQTGQFGADMQVHILNDGPVTFSLSS